MVMCNLTASQMCRLSTGIRHSHFKAVQIPSAVAPYNRQGFRDRTECRARTQNNKYPKEPRNQPANWVIIIRNRGGVSEFSKYGTGSMSYPKALTINPSPKSSPPSFDATGKPPTAARTSSRISNVSAGAILDHVTPLPRRDAAEENQTAGF